MINKSLFSFTEFPQEFCYDCKICDKINNLVEYEVRSAIQ